MTRTLDLAAVQTDPSFGDIPANVDAALNLLPDSCDLAVLPELFATGYQFRDAAEVAAMAEDPRLETEAGPICRALLEFAAERDTTIVAGLAESHEGRLFNSSILVRPDRSWEIYRKVHLFMDEKNLFTPGDLGFPVFEACGVQVGMMICFDWIFPEAARSLALAGAEILCHPSNLLLPWCQAAMVTRCQENMVHAVTANRVGTENRTEQELTFSGRSQVVSPMGQRLVGLDPIETGAAVAKIKIVEKDKQFTPRNHLFDDRRPEAYRS
jgi:predicted amidohydrolase